MKEILFSQIGFWSAFTILFILVVMAWFVYKMVKLSGEKPQIPNQK
jgi:hypothetical protein